MCAKLAGRGVAPPFHSASRLLSWTEVADGHRDRRKRWTMANKEVKQYIKRARKAGWRPDGWQNGTHLWMRWPATGARVPIPGTPSDGRCMRNIESRMSRISGPLPGGCHVKKAKRAAVAAPRNPSYRADTRR
jgi:hypothetical protein